MKESDLIEHLISKKYPTEQIMQFVLRFRELQKEKLSLQEFLAIQKEIEPKWSYEEKFFQKVINDYGYFLSSQQEIDFFLLEAPARTGKTELISGFGVPYIISQYKNVRIAIVAGNAALKRKLRKVITRMIKSKVFYDKYKIKIEIDNANEVTTSNGCLLFFTTILSQIPTGEGFHFIILEDAVTHTTITSEAKKENVYEQVDAFLTRTQDDPRTKLIVNNHRMATEDLSTRLIERYEEVNAKVLRITMPYQFSQDIIEKDIAGNEYVFNAGEFLISRFNEKTKNLILAKIGKEAFETQYQQNPISKKGTYIKEEYIMKYTGTKYQEIIFKEIFMTCDLAVKTGEKNDYTVVVLFGIMPNGRLFVIDILRGKWDTDRTKQIVNFWFSWQNRIKHVNSPVIHIEDAAGGHDLANHLKMYYKIPVRLITRTKDLETRIEAVMGFIESKTLWMPYNLAHFNKPDLMNEVYHEITSFVRLENKRDRRTGHDDVLSCIIDGLQYYKDKYYKIHMEYVGMNTSVEE